MAKSKLDSLLGAIKQQGPANRGDIESTEEVEPKTTKERKGPQLTAKGEKAKPRKSSIYLTAGDEKTLRELSAFLAGQGRRPNDSAILRTGLYLLQNGDDFLRAYDETMSKDGRIRRNEV